MRVLSDVPESGREREGESDDQCDWVLANALGLTVFELFDRVREQVPAPKRKGRK
jgi:hypothetical protein